MRYYNLTRLPIMGEEILRRTIEFGNRASPTIFFLKNGNKIKGDLWNYTPSDGTMMIPSKKTIYDISPLDVRVAYVDRRKK